MRIKNNIKNLFVISSLLFTSTFFVNNLSADENSNSLTSTITSSEKVQTSTISQITSSSQPDRWDGINFTDNL